MRILLADDHWAIRAGLVPLLQKLDDEVVVLEASSFGHALELALDDDDYDLVLIDLLMPDMDSFDGLRAVRDCVPEVPCVVVSMIDDRDDILRAINIGAAGYIQKAATPEDMLHALQRVLAGEIWLPRELVHGTLPEAKARCVPASVRSPADEPSAKLTERQMEVLHGLTEGRTNADIAGELGLSKHTVSLHVSAILRTLGVANRTQAAQFAGLKPAQLRHG